MEENEMMSVDQIMSDQMRATVKAAASKRQPFVVWPGDAAMIQHGHAREAIPFLGKYVPYGWKRVLDLNGDPVWYFVDSSGFGRADESALTLDAFASILIEGHGYGIIEAGQFQVVIGEYEKDET
jgi:hypothetical protein